MKLKHDEVLSIFAFNLRLYMMAPHELPEMHTIPLESLVGRCRLNR